MTKRCNHKQPLWVLAGIIFCMSAPGFSWAQSSGGYDGLMAPPPAAKSPNPASDLSQPPSGYSGLISGSDPAPQPRTRAPAMTTLPGHDAASFVPKTAEDAQLLAAARAADKDNDGVPDAMQQALAVSDQVKRRLEKPRQRIENMLPIEFAAKKNIEDAMASINNSGITPEQRAKNVGIARQKLSTLADAMRVKGQVPDTIYQKMGMSDVFIREEKEGTSNALALLDAALKELNKY